MCCNFVRSERIEVKIGQMLVLNVDYKPAKFQLNRWIVLQENKSQRKNVKKWDFSKIALISFILDRWSSIFDRTILNRLLTNSEEFKRIHACLRKLQVTELFFCEKKNLDVIY